MFGIIPLPYKLLAIVLSAIAIAFGSYLYGKKVNELKWVAKAAEMTARIAELEAQGQIETVKVITKYVTKIVEVEKHGQEIQSQIPTYVTSNDNARCVINTGFVRIHNSAAGEEIPDTSGVTNETPSGVALSTVASTVAGNYTSCRANAEQLKSLQEWVLKQEKVMNQ